MDTNNEKPFIYTGSIVHRDEWGLPTLRVECEYIGVAAQDFYRSDPSSWKVYEKGTYSIPALLNRYVETQGSISLSLVPYKGCSPIDIIGVATKMISPTEVEIRLK